MDRVRLGRALGYGTRHAAKTVAAMVEAAAATPAESRGAPGAARAAAERVPEPAVQRPTRQPMCAADLGRGASQLRRSVWEPLAVFSGALWLRVTGLFFGVIAFSVGAGAWRLHGGWYRGFGTPASTRFWLFVGVAAVFAYFAVSSFVRANLKERRGAAAARS